MATCLVAGAVAATGALTACSSPPGPAASGTTEDASAPCDISFLTFQSPTLTDQFWKERVAEVKKQYPNLNVKIDYIPGADFEGYTGQLLTAGNLPDVLWAAPLVDFVKAGALLPYAEADVAKDGAPQSVGQINGKHYSLSVGSQPLSMIFYNKDVFKSLGLTVPKTYPQFLETADKIKAVGKVPLLVGGGSAPWASTELLNGIINTDVISINPGWMRDRYADKVHFKDPDFKAAVTKWQKVVTGGYINEDALSVNYSQLISKFTDGKGVMYPMGAWAASTKASFEVGVFPLPTEDGNKIVLGNLPAQRMSVSAKTKCPAQAKAFSVALATSPKFADQFFKTDGLIPSLANWKLPQDTAALQKDTYEIFASKEVDFVPPFGSEGADAAPAGFTAVFDKSAQGIISGGSVDDFLAKVDQTFDDLNTAR